MSPKVEILSYFSIETDLAGEMRSWPELVSGTGYDYVEVRAIAEGPLFDRVLGRVIYALAAHSDNLQVWRH